MTYTPDPVPRRPMSRTARILLIVLGVACLLCLGGIAVAALAGDPDTNRDPAVAAQDDANRAAATSTPATTPPATRTSSAPAGIRVDDGTYTIGEDTPAGTYKVTERAGELCYWELAGPAEGDLKNGIGGGFPTFTATKGQRLTIAQCPPFALRK